MKLWSMKASLSRAGNRVVVGEAGSQTHTREGIRFLHSGQGEKPSDFPPRPSCRNLIPALVLVWEPLHASLRAIMKEEIDKLKGDKSDF